MKSILLIFCTLGSLTMLGQTAASNGLQQQLTEIWADGNWQNLNRNTFAYDTNNYIQHVLGEQWNTGSSAWTTATQRNYTNTSGGNVDTIVNQQWDGDSGAWINTAKSVWTYNANGTIASTLTQLWTGNNWLNLEQAIYTYDGSNYLINVLTKTWDAANNSWKTANQSNYTNDSQGKPLQILSQLYDTVSNLWTDYSKQTNTYTNNLVTYYLFEIYAAGNWTNSTEVFSTYDSQGRETQETFNVWSQVDNVWNPSSRITNTYGILGLDGFEKTEFFLYPNPATDVVNISTTDPLQSVSVYNLLGKNCNIPTENCSINVSALPAGIYILVAETENNKTQKKFVKK